jgi:hypothetical protein
MLFTKDDGGFGTRHACLSAAARERRRESSMTEQSTAMMM